jgi:protein-tyrosine phosphatase
MIAGIMNAIAAAPEGAVLFHCHAGKDRTGLIAALLLRLAGVPIEDVARDYALSADNLRAGTAQWIAEARDDKERMIREAIAATPPEAMRGVLDELERRHGTVARFLLEVGVGEETIERARARLRDQY